MRQFIVGYLLLAALVLAAVSASGVVGSNGPVWP
jgi:hypothetical protein